MGVNALIVTIVVSQAVFYLFFITSITLARAPSMFELHWQLDIPGYEEGGATRLEIGSAIKPPSMNDDDDDRF